MMPNKLIAALALMMVTFALTACSQQEKKPVDRYAYQEVYEVVSVYQYVEQETNQFGGVKDTEICYKFDYIDKDGMLRSVDGFKNLEYGTEKVQISNDYDKYVIDGYDNVIYLCLTKETMAKITGRGA